MVAACDKSAVNLVRLILMHFPGFRDTVSHHGAVIHFYKRAQILVGDLWAAYGRQTEPSHPYYFKDIDELTMFADYRVPQILRHMGILEYSIELAEIIDNKIEVPFASRYETEIRASTVVAVDILQKELKNRGVHLLVLEIDWLLWQIGEKMRNDIAPHHRTLTTYY